MNENPHNLKQLIERLKYPKGDAGMSMPNFSIFRDIAKALALILETIPNMESRIQGLDNRTMPMIPMGPGAMNIHAPDPNALQKAIDGMLEKKE